MEIRTGPLPIEPTIDVAIADGLVDEEELGPCPDCSVATGTAHIAGCDVERCSGCGLQRLGCVEAHHDEGKATWTGIWPGIVACRALGWVTAPFAGYPHGMADLNRYAVFSVTGEDPGSSFAPK